MNFFTFSKSSETTVVSLKSRLKSSSSKGFRTLILDLFYYKFVEVSKNWLIPCICRIFGMIECKYILDPGSYWNSPCLIRLLKLICFLLSKVRTYFSKLTTLVSDMPFAVTDISRSFWVRALMGGMRESVSSSSHILPNDHTSSASSSAISLWSTG
jgi:hypothetical protein